MFTAESTRSYRKLMMLCDSIRGLAVTENWRQASKAATCVQLQLRTQIVKEEDSYLVAECVCDTEDFDPCAVETIRSEHDRLNDYADRIQWACETHDRNQLAGLVYDFTNELYEHMRKEEHLVVGIRGKASSRSPMKSRSATAR